jgi:hypothetical protein
MRWVATVVLTGIALFICIETIDRWIQQVPIIVAGLLDLLRFLAVILVTVPLSRAIRPWIKNSDQWVRFAFGGLALGGVPGLVGVLAWYGAFQNIPLFMAVLILAFFGAFFGGIFWFTFLRRSPHWSLKLWAALNILIFLLAAGIVYGLIMQQLLPVPATIQSLYGLMQAVFTIGAALAIYAFLSGTAMVWILRRRDTEQQKIRPELHE